MDAFDTAYAFEAWTEKFNLYEEVHFDPKDFACRGLTIFDVTGFVFEASGSVEEEEEDKESVWFNEARITFLGVRNDPIGEWDVSGFQYDPSLKERVFNMIGKDPEDLAYREALSRR